MRVLGEMLENSQHKRCQSSQTKKGVNLLTIAPAVTKPLATMLLAAMMMMMLSRLSELDR